ncbi:lactonase family protein [Paraglaciecola aquimarina]|uniref:Lactonase family protein n=1 Tax=Paraglaciecola algarum TaxID=3050085 RepID=A0ABS9D6F9_9ALTE|nr:lactonase family protein [Paraglaciecola sp. G1-23]MCF2948015.1 lactonase family protein [Paraglaciecola sp. G1-23]
MVLNTVRFTTSNWVKIHTFGALLCMIGFSQLALAEQDVYFGTGSKLGDGIYHAVLNDDSGELSSPKKVADIKAPGFLAQHPSLEVLYAVASIDKKPVVAAYKMAKNGQLSFINSVEIGDGGGAHIAVHSSGKFLLTAQYGGNSVALFSLDAKGSLIERAQLIEHQGGSNVVPNRQKKPHPHWVGFSPDGQYAFVPDLGMDTIMIYRVATDKPQLISHGRADSVPGGGPRHMRFSTNGEYIYLLNEFALSVSSFAYNKEAGTATLMSVTPTLDEGLKRQEAFNSASEILVHPSGLFVYSANRGHDSVSVFHNNEVSGKLALQETESVRGSYPRNINLDNTGKWLFAAGQHSNTVSVFAIDQTNGLLQYQTGKTVNVPEPICVLFKH